MITPSKQCVPQLSCIPSSAAISINNEKAGTAAILMELKEAPSSMQCYDRNRSVSMDDGPEEVDLAIQLRQVKVS